MVWNGILTLVICITEEVERMGVGKAKLEFQTYLGTSNVPLPFPLSVSSSQHCQDALLGVLWYFFHCTAQYIWHRKCISQVKGASLRALLSLQRKSIVYYVRRCSRSSGGCGDVWLAEIYYPASAQASALSGLTS